MHKDDCVDGSGGFVNAGRVDAKRRWLPLRNLAVVAAVGAVLGRIGPFDTFSELPTLSRYAYWIGLTLLLWLQTAIAMHLLRDASDWSWPARTVVAALLGALPAAFEVAWAEGWLRVTRDLGLVDVAMIYGDVALIAVALALPLELIDGHRLVARLSAAPAHRAVNPVAVDELIAALPPQRRGTLLALEAEDHYLRVHTDRGNALIHKRLSDALTEVQAIDGLRVHRSWWVAKAAIERVERHGDRLSLHLTNRLVVPVSRTYALAVREAGFTAV
jgi:hypothetical protein